MTRRPKGTGSISLRADGRWRGSCPGQDGKRKYVHAWTRGEVEAKLAALIDSESLAEAGRRERAKARAPRPLISNRVRFDVLERDGFRCRYCGSGPEEGVVLVVDHVVPITAGGTSAMDNLVAACQACNAGKAARILRVSGTVGGSNDEEEVVA